MVVVAGHTDEVAAAAADEDGQLGVEAVIDKGSGVG